MCSISLCAVFYYWIAQSVFLHATVPGQYCAYTQKKARIKIKKERIKCKHWFSTIYVCAPVKIKIFPPGAWCKIWISLLKTLQMSLTSLMILYGGLLCWFCWLVQAHSLQSGQKHYAGVISLMP